MRRVAAPRNEKKLIYNFLTRKVMR